MQPLAILKIGGNVLANDQALDQLLSTFAAWESPAILVHGGGRRASELLPQLGIQPQMINGRRITDEATLEVVTMVYAGLLNKTIVAQLQAKGCNAIGVSGADGNLIQAHQRVVETIDYGFAGDIDRIDTAGFSHLLEAGWVPVCCPITHDRKGQLLNTNADTIAATIAAAMGGSYAISLSYCFEKPGVLADAEDDGSVIPKLSSRLYREYRSEGRIHSGMIPKLDSAFQALEQGVGKVYIGNVQSLRSGTATEIV